MALSTWRNRIVGHGDEDPRVIRPNPQNWRVHGEEQSEALADALTEVGWVQRIIVNKRTGHLLDGHLRVDLARRRNEASVPVLYVDLSEAEEALVLATFDPLGAIAEANTNAYDTVLRQVQTESANLQQFLSKQAERIGLFADSDHLDDVDFKEYDEDVADEVEYLTCPQCGHKWPK